MIGEDEKEATQVAVKKNLYFFCNNQEELYAELDRKLAVPLIPEFRDYMLTQLQTSGILEKLTVHSLGRQFEAWHMCISSAAISTQRHLFS